MAAASSPSPFFGLREDEFNNQMKQQQQQQPDSSQPMTAPAPAPAPPKKKRNLPGNPSKFIYFSKFLNSTSFLYLFD